MRSPWLFVVFAFVLLITAWTVLIVTAVKNRPAHVVPAGHAEDSETSEH